MIQLYFLTVTQSAKRIVFLFEIGVVIGCEPADCDVPRLTNPHFYDIRRRSESNDLAKIPAKKLNRTYLLLSIAFKLKCCAHDGNHIVKLITWSEVVETTTLLHGSTRRLNLEIRARYPLFRGWKPKSCLNDDLKAAIVLLAHLEKDAWYKY